MCQDDFEKLLSVYYKAEQGKKNSLEPLPMLRDETTDLCYRQDEKAGNEGSARDLPGY